MSEPVNIGDATLYLGDVLAVLAGLPAESVHCVVTSPPYWGLRDYGTGTWEGGSAECDHRSSGERRQLPHGDGRVNDSYADERHILPGVGAMYKEVCGKCGAHRIDQQIGLEETPEQYVAKMVAVFREVRRVLRADGTAWVNLGDSYVGGGRGFGGEGTRESARSEQGRIVGPPTGAIAGLKPKDLVGIPWRVAFALQADGWYLRSDIIWAKPNPMPESVTDRPTKAHEYVFLLTKSARYWYDADAVREDAINAGKTIKTNGNDGMDAGYDGHRTRDGFRRGVTVATRRNRRTVWTIATEPFPGAHFATFPRKLVEPCILAGCPRKVCPECGAPWVKEIEKSGGTTGHSWHDHSDDLGKGQQKNESGMDTYRVQVTGEHPTCTCGREAISGTVLDPFGGSMTTMVVALSHGRRGVAIELKPDYFEMGCNRLRHGTVDPEEVARAESQFALFDAGAQGSHE